MLIKCSECGGDVSDKAKACPHCGCPVQEMNLAKPAAKEDKPTSTFDVCVEAEGDKIVNSTSKIHRRRGFRRVPVMLWIAGVVNILPMCVILLVGMAVGTRRGGGSDIPLVFWFLFAISLGMSIALVQGKSWARLWITIGWLFYIFANMLNFPAVLLVGFWAAIILFLVYSGSSDRWFKAHKRLVKMKRFRENRIQNEFSSPDLSQEEKEMREALANA